MSNDILERLRAAHPGSMQLVVGSKILAEAADEIERLRAVILNIQALAEGGRQIDTDKLATRCRVVLQQKRTET